MIGFSLDDYPDPVRKLAQDIDRDIWKRNMEYAVRVVEWKRKK